jgi:hypothetical protein
MKVLTMNNIGRNCILITSFDIGKYLHLCIWIPAGIPPRCMQFAAIKFKI